MVKKKKRKEEERKLGRQWLTGFIGFPGYANGEFSADVIIQEQN